MEKIGLAGGLFLLAYLIYQSGFWVLLGYLRRVGWGILLLLLIAAVRHCFRTAACRWAMGDDRWEFSYAAMWAVLLVAEAIKFVAFAGLLVGESAKALLLRRRVSTARAASSVVLDVLLYNLSAALFLLGGTALLFTRLSLVPEVQRTLSAGALAVAVLLLLVFLAFTRRQLTAERILGALARLPMAGALRVWVERHRQKIVEADDQVFRFQQRHAGLLYAILLFDMVAHCISAFEVFVALRLLGLDLGYADAVAVEVLTKVIRVGGTIVPANVGLFEGGTGLILTALGARMASGVALGIVRQLRSILWAGLGFIAWWWLPGEPAGS